MTAPTRAQLAPIVHALVLGALVTAAIAWASFGSLVWMVDHPEAFGGGVLVLSRVVGMVVARLPHFGTSPRTIETQQARVHDEVDGIIDRLAVVKAELDILADTMIHLRAKLPKEE